MSIVRHTSYNIIGALVPIVVSLVTVPLYLKLIGLERYGVLTIVWVIIGYFNFFDFGLGRATAQHIASSGAEDVEARNRAFWTGLSLSVTFATCAVLVALPVAEFALHTLKLGASQLRREVVGALPLLLAAIPVSILQSMLRGALEGRRLFLAINTILSTGAVVTAALPLIVAYSWGPAIPGLVAATVVVRVTVLAGLAVAATVGVPVGRPVRPHRADIRRMLAFGVWLTLSYIVGPLMAVFDRFFIGALIGAAAVALYVIPFNLVSQLVLIPTALGTALFPRFAAEGTSGASNRHELVRATAFLLTPLAFAAVVIVGPFLHLWIGRTAAAQSTPIAYILMIGFWANGVAQLPLASLQAAARTDTTAKVHLIEVIPYLLLLWAALKWIGLAGAAIAWTLRGTADLFALAILDRTPASVLRSLLLQTVALSVVALVMLGTAPTPLIRSAAIVALALVVGIYLVLNAPPVLVARVRPWLPHMRSR